MAALNRPTEATYEIHEFASVDTQDNEDHTFCGIMFPVKCKDLLPIDHLVIKSVAVRGCLGPMTVWVSNPEQHQRRTSSDATSVQERIRLDPKYWTKLYEKTHKASRYEYKELMLTSPIRLHPGETRVIYIHSTLPGDEAIVYDNTYYGQSSKRYEDDKIAILSGRAHVSNEVFGQEPIWGWGNAWRDRREFVGRLNYGTVYKLWNPQVQPKFGSNFQDGARALFLCQRRWESPWSMLPDECIFYILNMCRWDWFHDDAGTMRQRRKREKTKLQEQKEQEQKQQEKRALEAAVAGAAEDDEKPASCHRRCKKARAQAIMDSDDDDDDDGDYTEDDAKMSAVDAHDQEMEDTDDSEDGAGVVGEVFSEDDDDDDWSDDEDQYHRANIEAFTYHDVDSDNEDSNEREAAAIESTRREWIRRQFARIHVLRALAMEDDNVAAA
eukprot:CAMPEP_0176025302 /NCGR_PEP_ID=MMETSP0120_2-20121206/12376_1 /TAXON_ID=160619 /ORGANISM="Kryptoperidinium foliaceum, Strain CCMP 1326" /LENGTH=439 /DNA_ID=CAMNT_0017358485 /DNA_START=70 /DNA_END=1385 /DNA_ORIENTATION=-